MSGSEAKEKDLQVMSPSEGLTLPVNPPCAATTAGMHSQQSAVADPVLQFQCMQDQQAAFQRMQNQQVAAAEQREQVGLIQAQNGGEDDTLSAVGPLNFKSNFIAMAVPSGDSPNLSMTTMTPRVLTQTVDPR